MVYFVYFEAMQAKSVSYFVLVKLVSCFCPDNVKIFLLYHDYECSLCVVKACVNNEPCAGRALRNAFLSNGQDNWKAHIKLARIIRYVLLQYCVFASYI